MWQNVHISHIYLNSQPDFTNISKNHVTKREHFASGKGGHDVTETFVGMNVMLHVTIRPPQSQGG
jgi:hypothetical protein